MFKKLILVASLFTSFYIFADPKIEIQQTLDNFANVWNTHDAKKMSEFWAPDGDLINPWGKWADGREGVLKLFEGEQKGAFKNSTQKFVVEKVRLIGPITAFVDANSFMKLIEGKREKDMSHHLSLLMAKKEGKWWVLAARPYMYAPAKKSSNKEEKSKP